MAIPRSLSSCDIRGAFCRVQRLHVPPHCILEFFLLASLMHDESRVVPLASVRLRHVPEFVSVLWPDVLLEVFFAIKLRGEGAPLVPEVIASVEQTLLR